MMVCSKTKVPIKDLKITQFSFQLEVSLADMHLLLKCSILHFFIQGALSFVYTHPLTFQALQSVSLKFGQKNWTQIIKYNFFFSRK